MSAAFEPEPWWSGDPVRGQPCPRCGRHRVVYNGNYFCEACPWAMGEHGRPVRIVKAYLMQRWRKAQADGDTAEMDRLGAFLLAYERSPR